MTPSNDHISILNDALQLEEELDRWEKCQSEELKASTIGSAPRRTSSIEYAAGYWPGNVDTYFDPYVAIIWNSYRAARLYLFDLISGLVSTREDPKVNGPYNPDLDHLLEDVLASIPYHLTENLHQFIKNVEIDTSISIPGKTASGLLLMHPLHVISTLPIVDVKIQTYLKRCLFWIGDHMGVGQATLMAKVGGTF